MPTTLCPHWDLQFIDPTMSLPMANHYSTIVCHVVYKYHIYSIYTHICYILHTITCTTTLIVYNIYYIQYILIVQYIYIAYIVYYSIYYIYYIVYIVYTIVYYICYIVYTISIYLQYSIYTIYIQHIQYSIYCIQYSINSLAPFSYVILSGQNETLVKSSTTDSMSKPTQLNVAGENSHRLLAGFTLNS